MFRTTGFTQPSRVVVGAALAFAFAFVTACSGDAPQVPTKFAPAGAATTVVSGTVATTIAVPPQVQILDANGRGIKGLKVRWRVAPGSGGVGNDSTTTDGSGIALSGGWTLGSVAGTQTLVASADGLPSVTFTAQAGPGPAATLIRVGPSSQQATVNSAVPVAPTVRAEDVFGNIVPGVPVSFSVATGGGSIAGAQQTTGQDGVATAGSWTLGTGVGQQLARATAPNVAPTAFSATAVAGPAADMVKAAGDNQDAVAGLPVSVGTRRPRCRRLRQSGGQRAGHVHRGAELGHRVEWHGGHRPGHGHGLRRRLDRR